MKERLYSRNSDSGDIIEKRLINAKEEINSFLDYDYLIINDDLEKSTKEILAIANIARRKTKLFSQDEIVNNWLK